jgi:8-oxo-dGTP pyrophosphatase MutT (NUDIX family)
MERDPDLNSGEIAVQQAGVVAFRRAGSGIEFCLVSGRRSGRWGFPKGHVGPCTSHREAALCEAWQEAGLKGQIVGEPLGRIVYRKSGRECELVLWLMHAETSLATWKESEERTRIWVPLRQALRLLDQSRWHPFLGWAAERLTRDAA